MLSYKQNVYACIHVYEYEFFTCKMCRLSVIYISYTVGSSYDKVLGGGMGWWVVVTATVYYKEITLNLPN